MYTKEHFNGLCDVDEKYRIMGVDPGISNLGVAIIDYDIFTGDITVISAFTLHPPALMRENPQLSEILTERGAKLFYIERGLLSALETYSPHNVASEAPFLSSFPQAYAALVEVVISIRNAFYRYKPYAMLTTIPPTVVKTNAGVYGRSSDKNDMLQALSSHSELDTSKIELDALDEHAIDAIFVAYCKLRMLLGTDIKYERPKRKNKSKRDNKKR